MNRIDLSGQVGVVTGGAQGLGLAMARRLLASGAKVGLWDMNGERLEAAKAELGEGAAITVVDITDAEAVVEAHRQTEAALGPVSILVNSAGIAGPNHTLDAYPLADWKRVIDINLHGTFHVNRAVVPGMKARNYGRIVNIASIARKEGNPNASAYSASKAAVIGLTKAVAADFIRRGIRANAICPGTVDSPSLDGRIAALARQTGRTEAAVRKEFEDRQPLGRLGTPREIAMLAVYLASDEASFTTGGVFMADGGFSL